tara:strand:+ start:810 stop:977 length:168 start_codon:yes stop_codon:yes gene_type:complete
MLLEYLQALGPEFEGLEFEGLEFEGLEFEGLEFKDLEFKDLGSLTRPDPAVSEWQ